MYSAYKLNKQGDNKQPGRPPFPIWNQSVVPCPVLTVASWPAYRFLKRQVRWSGIPFSFRIFHSLWWSTQSKALAQSNKAEIDVFVKLSCFFDGPEDVGNLISGFTRVLLLLSCCSHVRLCATPQTAAHQAPPSLGFSRQEHWSGLPFPSPMNESESLSCVPLPATPWTAAYQAPQSIGFSRQEIGVSNYETTLCVY